MNADTSQNTSPEYLSLYRAPAAWKKSFLYFGSTFRRRRHALVVDWLQSLNLPRPYSILDLGGTPQYWSYWKASQDAVITCVNLDTTVASDHPNIQVVHGDATDLSAWPDQSHDVVFSNSLIEHLYSFEAQERLSREIHRVGKHFFVQTPNRYFPIEPHFYRIPCFHFMPYPLKLYLLRRYRCGFYGPIKECTPAEDLLAEIRLCNQTDLQKLFPTSRLAPEAVGPFVKSWMVFSS